MTNFITKVKNLPDGVRGIIYKYLHHDNAMIIQRTIRYQADEGQADRQGCLEEAAHTTLPFFSVDYVAAPAQGGCSPLVQRLVQ